MIDSETLLCLIQIYYEHLEIFKQKNMRLEDLVTKYKKLYGSHCVEANNG